MRLKRNPELKVRQFVLTVKSEYWLHGFDVSAVTFVRVSNQRSHRVFFKGESLQKKKWIYV